MKTDRPGKSEMGSQLCCGTVWTSACLDNNITINITGTIIIAIIIVAIITILPAVKQEIQD